MRPELETYHLIDRYLSKDLSGEELSAFTQRLAQDPAFAEDVAMQRRLNDVILEAELKSVRTQMRQDLPSIPHTSFFGTYWKWFGAGILMLSALLLYTWKETPAASVATDSTVIEQEEVPSEKTIISGNTEHTAVQKTQTASTETAAQSSIQKASAGGQVIDSVPLQTVLSKPNIIYPTAHKAADTVQTEPAAVQKIDCSKNGLTFTLQTQATCAGEEEGSVTIADVKGGARPYHFTLNEQELSSRSINGMAAGNYVVTLTDGNGCLVEKKVVITEKLCQKQITKLNINPAIGESCRIPFASNKTGNVTIYSRNGNVIYKAGNNGEDFVEWNGTNGHGSLTEPGLYIYIIEYSDGVKENGEVNISR